MHNKSAVLNGYQASAKYAMSGGEKGKASQVFGYFGSVYSYVESVETFQRAKSIVRAGKEGNWNDESFVVEVETFVRAALLTRNI